MLAHGSDSDESTPPMTAPTLARQIDFGEMTIVLGSDPEEEVAVEEQGDLLTDDGEGAAGDLLTDDEASNSPTDTVPLVSLGRKFLSDSQFGAVASWVVESPGASRLELARQEREEEDRLVEDLLRDTPEGNGVKPNSFSSSRASGGSSQQTSKAGLSQGTSKADISSQASSKTGLSSQGTSKAGGSWSKLPSLDDTVDEFDKMCLTPKAKTSFSDAPKNLQISIQITPTQRPVSPRTSKIRSQNSRSADHRSTSKLGKAIADGDDGNSQEESHQGSLHLRLSPSQEDASSLHPPPSNHSPLSMAGGDTILSNVPNATLNLDGLGSGGSVTLNSTVDSRKPQRPIDNSVAGVAVRSWTPNLTKLGRARHQDKEVNSSKVGQIWGDLEVSKMPSSVSEGVEGQVKERGRKQSGSSSGEEALSNFLTKVVTNRKKVIAFNVDMII